MKSDSHFITAPEPLNGRYAQSVCEKDCEIYRDIPTDCDLQAIELSTLTKCKGCLDGTLMKYVYIGKVKRKE
jgi:hypothetical protein